MQRSGQDWSPVKDDGDLVAEPQLGLCFQETSWGQAGSSRVENTPPHLGWKPEHASSNVCRDSQWGQWRSLRDLEKLWVLKDLGMVQC